MKIKKYEVRSNEKIKKRVKKRDGPLTNIMTG